MGGVSGCDPRDAMLARLIVDGAKTIERAGEFSIEHNPVDDDVIREALGKTDPRWRNHALGFSPIEGMFNEVAVEEARKKYEQDMFTDSPRPNPNERARLPIDVQAALYGEAYIEHCDACGSWGGEHDENCPDFQS